MARRSWLALAGALALALAWAGHAQAALSLQDLMDGVTFLSLDGSLTFDQFDVAVRGDLDSDFSLYALTVLGDGFRLEGPTSPIAMQDGEFGLVLLTYQVDGTRPIRQASLSFEGTAIGPFGVARVLESAAPFALGDAFAGTNSFAPTFSQSFDPVTPLSVRGAILVSTVGAGQSATLDFVEHRFAVVPEPAGLVLAGLGLVGLAILGRCRRLRLLAARLRP